jgi:DNA helicase-2/ATP-dependent DNA helicase PcrA
VCETRVLTCRIAYLLKEDRHQRVLAVTFTRKAAGEMQQRVEKLLRQQQEHAPPIAHIHDDDIYQEMESTLPEGLDRVTLGTFHSLCAKILRWNGNLLASLPSVVQDMVGSTNAANLDGGFAILDQADQLRILKECLNEQEIDLKISGIKPMIILSAISTIKEDFAMGKVKSNVKGKPVPKSVKIAEQIYGNYRRKLFANNAVDFDDLIFLSREMLMGHQELRLQLHRRWPHILVDEFQDTSRSQMDLIKLLTSSSLLIVGDADQSIYSWRGANVGSLTDFAEEFKHFLGCVHSVFLMENYR